MAMKVGSVQINDITNDWVRKEAVKVDKNNDGRLTETEAPDLYQHALKYGKTGSNAGISAGLTVAFAASKYAKTGGAWGAAFQAIGSGTRNMEAVKQGRMTATEAVVDTLKDTAIAGTAAAAGAALGAAVGSVVPVAGTLVGIVVGAQAGHFIDLALHEMLDE